jgi:hypothetical protein
MKTPRPANRCGAEGRCAEIALYRVHGVGPDIRTGAKAAAVTIYACDAHLSAARQRVERRTTRSTELISTPPDRGQPTLFDL